MAKKGQSTNMCLASRLKYTLYAVTNITKIKTKYNTSTINI